MRWLGLPKRFAIAERGHRNNWQVNWKCFTKITSK